MLHFFAGRAQDAGPLIGCFYVHFYRGIDTGAISTSLAGLCDI